MSAKEVQLKYFALFREQRGLSAETRLTGANTLADFYDELCIEFGFSLKREHIRVSKNEDLCSWDQELESGDRIVFIPPAAGG